MNKIKLYVTERNEIHAVMADIISDNFVSVDEVAIIDRRSLGKAYFGKAYFETFEEAKIDLAQDSFNRIRDALMDLNNATAAYSHAMSLEESKCTPR